MYEHVAENPHCRLVFFMAINVFTVSNIVMTRSVRVSTTEVHCLKKKHTLPLLLKNISVSRNHHFLAIDSNDYIWDLLEKFLGTIESLEWPIFVKHDAKVVEKVLGKSVPISGWHDYVA